MPRYFFELVEGEEVLPDGLGSVCINDRATISCAWTMLAQCIGQPTRILPWQNAAVSVDREDGQHIGRIIMTMEVELRQRAAPCRAAFLRDVDGPPV